MKTLFKSVYVIAMLCALIFSIKTNAQITFEQSYPGPNSTAFARLQLINMGTNEYKYQLVNYNTNELKLYNLNHSLYATVSVPVTLIDPSVYNIGYVTRALFDCDSSKFEYAIMAQSSSNPTFYVYRQDGTLLLKKDSCVAPYCIGCFGGSYDVRPIVNTPSGAKLFLMKTSGAAGFLTTDVYSLCGNMPTQLIKNQNEFESIIKVFPNPSSGDVQFELDLPSNTQDYKLVIYDASGQTIYSSTIRGTTKKITLQNSTISSGLYLYSITSDNNMMKTGKFIINQ